MVSVVIASRVDQYLQPTIDDLLAKAKGEVEVIVILDGYWPNPMIRTNPRVHVVHQGTIHDNWGMRAAINTGIDIARGEYVMKIDEHCMVDEGWDVKLVADMQDDWLVIPRRYRLDAENWQLIEDGRPPIDYMYLAYPYERPYDRNCGLHGAEWKQLHYDRKDVLIDDTMSWQGSCYFFKKSHWQKLFPEGLDEERYGSFTQEAQEIGNTYWLSGGAIKVNKKTWYAHFHKGKRGKGYGFSREQYRKHEAEKEKGRLYCIEYWLNTKDFKYDFEWLLKKFWPVPTWPEDWRTRIVEDAKTDWSQDPSKQPTEWL